MVTRALAGVACLDEKGDLAAQDAISGDYGSLIIKWELVQEERHVTFRSGYPMTTALCAKAPTFSGIDIYIFTISTRIRLNRSWPTWTRSRSSSVICLGYSDICEYVPAPFRFDNGPGLMTTTPLTT